eukprot:TRINITY_DN11640_c2_g3_i9.p1 TRINITY_DN11640_c2_g3~~TRINITY_DN11640_c2_g3_i9.p1  ORF type:complete len:817 (+),score=178.68 TRINITY_DN11640_c2_g3_i9:44-2452(+)
MPLKAPSRLPRPVAPARTRRKRNNRSGPALPVLETSKPAFTPEFNARIEAVLNNANLYNLGQVGPSAFLVGTLKHKRYKVIIGPQTCSECRHGHCDHILFVMLRVLKLDSSSQLLLNPTLHNYEVESLLTNVASPTPLPAVVAGKDNHHHHHDHDDNNCPICLSHVVEAERTIRCQSCLGCLHIRCMTLWADSEHARHQPVTCPLCRNPWRAVHPDIAQDTTAPLAPPSLDKIAAARWVDPARQAEMTSWLLLIQPEQHDVLKQQLFSTRWHERVEGCQQLGALLTSVSLAALATDHLLMLLLHVLQDPVLLVLQAGLALVCHLPQGFDESFWFPILQQVVRRCNDANHRLRDVCLDTLPTLVLNALIPSHWIVGVLCPAHTPKHESHTHVWRWYAAQLTALNFVLERYAQWLVTSPLSRQRPGDLSTGSASLAKTETGPRNYVLSMVEEWEASVKTTGHARVIKAWRRAKKLASELVFPTAVAPGDPPEDSDNDCHLVFDEDSSDSCSSSPEPANTCCQQLLPVVTPDYQENVAWLRGGCLGAGAKGRVWEWTDGATSYQGVVKEVLLPCKLHGDKRQQAIESIQQEALLLQRLPHPHIVRYFGATTTHDAVNVFMELAPLGSIKDYLDAHGPAEVDVSLKYGHQIAQALAHLHHHGIIHRDVKGANVLLASPDHAKLADFGDARVLQGDCTLTGEVNSCHGSPAWMSPETIKGVNIGRKTDVWSLACLLVELLTGLAPWAELKASNAYALMYHIAETEQLPLFPASTPSDLEVFLVDCFQRQANLRPTSADAVSHLAAML